jgi:thiamine-monophosphate kinase
VSSTPLGPGAEFDVIRGVLKDAAAPGAMVALGAGDDCALLRSGGEYLAVTVDLFVEGVHFMSSWGSPEQVGSRAARAAISDLAAMAAEPAAILVSLSAPAGEAPELAERIGAGCRDAAEALGASLIGGDLSRGGPGLALDVAAVGYVSEPLLRSGARPGDEIWVTGRLGAAAAAVEAWKEGSADAGHVAAASGVGLEIDYEAVPAASGVDAEAALGGGEDYELLVAVPDGILSAEATTEFERAFAIPLTRVFRDGEEVRVALRGFDHFKDLG